MIVESEKFPFLVTHVEADGKLLKIWAQTDERLVQTIKSVLTALMTKIDYHGTSNTLLSHNISSYTHCCTLGVNNEFCRVKLCSLRQEDLILVKFIDYGNVTYIPIQNIYSLDNFSEAKPLFSLPEAASVFILADVLPIGGSWLDDVITQIRSILVNNKYYGVYQSVKNFKMLKFNMMNNNFSQILINRNMAVYSPSCTQAIQQMMPHVPVRTPHQTSNIPQDNWRIPVSQNTAAVQKVVKSNSFKAIQLEIGSVHDVQISYVDEGPCKFSVQLLESIPYLNSMMEKINTQSHLPLQEPPIAGQVCLGKQTHLNRLCRIVLNSPGDTSCKVYYADYGHHEVLPFSDIYQIPDEFVVPNIFSIRFTLSGIINWIVSDEMKDYFGGLVYNKKLKLRVCQGPMSPLIQYCDLFLHGKNVKDTLTENFSDLCQLMYSKPRDLKNGTREVVFVSYVESTTQFFVQIESDGKLLEEVMSQIEQASKTAAKLNPTQIYPDMPCIALYEADQNWYRASILSIVDNDNMQVFYVDYGNQEVVSINNIRAIPLELIKILPKQAIKCSLNGFQSGTVDKELIKNFESLVLEERLNLIVLNNHHDILIVDLFDEENLSDPIKKNITKKLKSLETSKQQKIVTSNKFAERNLESSKPLQVTNQNDNWTGNWEKEGGQNQSFKTNNNFESHENSKPKFRKDNENERFENRYKRFSNDYSIETQSNRFDKDGSKVERFTQNNRFSRNNLNGSSGSKDYSNNDRYSRTSIRNNSFDSNDFHVVRTGKENRSSVSSRLDRHFGSDKSSDKESDTSSRSNGRRNNRIGRRNSDDHRKHDVPSNNRNRPGRWENEERENDPYRKNNNSDVNTKLKLPKDNNIFGLDKSRNAERETAHETSVYNSTETPRYSMSIPISKIPPPNITVGAIKNCTIVYYNDPSSFYVQLCPDNEELNLIMNKIFTSLQNGGKAVDVSEITSGLQCIAQYSGDEQWYRAVIKATKAHEATVHFVDYGNVETVSFDKIKEIEPEFLKLPAQAVHCKLFCPTKTEWTTKESELLSDKIDDKLLEAEFVTEKNGVYNILIKEVTSNKLDTVKYINDLFANGIDLIKEKEAMRNKTREINKTEKYVLSDYASLEEKWLENKLDSGTKYNVLLTWFINPESFYCQLINQQEVFREMMNDIQTTYVKRQPVSEQLKIGSSVIAVLPDDGILYRAEIIELHKPRGHVVQYIDYGDRAMVDPRNIYAVEKKFMTLPRQAFFCSLKNIAPVSGSNWPNSTEMSQFFNVDKFDCIFHELKNGKYFISLMNNGIDISSALVDKNMAIFSSLVLDEMPKEDSIEMHEVPRMDINLLEGQTLNVKVSNVESVAKFYVQFHTAEICQTKVDTFMACIDPQMLGLPAQLSVMQNQAIECALFDVPFSTKADEILKKKITGKNVLIFVETVECNRLVVRLFDSNGNKIQVNETQNIEAISPVCNMQILSSTHDVTVTWINSSNSIWLQRISEKAIVNQLFEELLNYYSKVTECVVPHENQIYAALNDDGIWYRAKVTKLKETKTTVIFIDFGIIKDIPTKNLRILEPRFYVPHQLSVEVSLTVSLNGSESPERDVLEPILMDKVFSATLYNVNRKWIAELTENNEKISEKLALLNVVKETTKKQFEYVELPEMLVGEKYGVIVAHVDSPHQLWLQRSEQLNNIVELQNQLQQASSPFLDSGVVPAVKSLYLAMYSLNNQWYRAEVLDADIDITTVRFIDYGSTDVIDNSMARLKQLPDKWKTIDGYAIPCKLDVLPATADDWSKEACTRFSNLVLTQKPLQALIIADKAPIRIDLFLEDRSICKILVDERLASFLNCSEELEEEMIEEIELDPRSAFVSSIISVDRFWMQEDKYVNELEMMQDRLMMASILQPVTEIKEGLICIAHFPDDNFYYRAIVLSQNEDGTIVRYIDYGNSAITKDLRMIPEDLVEIRPLSRKCRLAKPDGIEHWPHGINEEFTKLADEGSTIFLLDVIEEGETCLVKLTHDSQDVVMKLLELCTKTNQTIKQDDILEEVENIITEERLSPIGTGTFANTEVCTVCYVSSPSEFWIHKKSHYSDLNAIMDKLLTAESLDLVTNIKEGKILAAKFDEDGQWYRSKVLSYGENGTEVFYIDYGNTAVTDSQSTLRELPDNLIRIPPLATCCSLKMPEGLENWSKTVCEKFMDLTEDLSIEYRFKILNKNNHLESEQPMQLSLFYQDQDIVEILMNHEKKVETDEITKQRTEDSGFIIFANDNIIQSEMKHQNSQEPKNTASSDNDNIQIEMEHQKLQETIENISSDKSTIRFETEQQSQESKHTTLECDNSVQLEIKQLSQEIKNAISSFDSTAQIKTEQQKSQKFIDKITSSNNAVEIETEKLQLRESNNLISSLDNNIQIKMNQQQSQESAGKIKFFNNPIHIKMEAQHVKESKDTVTSLDNNILIKTKNQESQKSINKISFNDKTLQNKIEQQQPQESTDSISLLDNHVQFEIERLSQEFVDKISNSDNNDQIVIKE